MTITSNQDPTPPITIERPHNWLQMIWREWRNCEDEEYAAHLYPLVVDMPVDGLALIVLAVVGGLFGALSGWLVTLLLYPDTWSGGLIALGLLGGAAAGGLVGFLAGLAAKSTRPLCWGDWLQSLIPGKPLARRPQESASQSLLFAATVGLCSGMGAGITGGLFFGQPNGQFYALLVGLAIIGAGSFTLERQTTIIDAVIGIPFGVVFGIFFGLGFGQIVGQLAGPLDVANSARVVGLGTGLGVGLLVGRWSGWLGTLSGLTILALLLPAISLNLVLLSWLVGMLLGGALGALSALWRPPQPALAFEAAYTYRRFYVWWRLRPLATQVEAALQPHPLLTRLRHTLEQAQTPAKLIEALRKDSWSQRFLTRHTLVALGGAAVPELAVMAENKRHYHQKLAQWLIRSIGHETTARLANQAAHLRCSLCLTAVSPHQISQPAITFYGCRICGQSRDFLECERGVVAVLDERWLEAQQHEAGLLRVNWLTRRELFDFDRVEIIRATDEEVERFAVQVGNDTDTYRAGRYAGLPCTIAPACELSDNTLRILERIFGEARRG